MSLGELIKKKAELEETLRVLYAHTIDEVCQELGEVEYLIGKEEKRYGCSE